MRQRSRERQQTLQTLLETSFSQTGDEVRQIIAERIHQAPDTVEAVAATWEELAERGRAAAGILTDGRILDAEGDERQALLNLAEAADRAEDKYRNLDRLVKEARSTRGNRRKKLEALLKQGVRLSEALQQI